MELDNLELSIRATNALRMHGIDNLENLQKYSAGILGSLRGFGNRTIRELREKLLEHGMCLAGESIVTSVHGIELVKEIPQKLKELSDQLGLIYYEIRELQTIVKTICVMYQKEIR